MKIREKIREHKEAVAAAADAAVGAAGLGLIAEGSELTAVARGVTPEVITKVTPIVVNETSISTVQKLVPVGSQYVQSLQLPTTWAIFAGGNSTTNIFAQIDLSTPLSAGNSTLIPMTTEGMKQVASLGGGVTQTALSPITSTMLGQGNSTIISLGPHNGLKLTFDGVMWVNGQQQGIFNFVLEKMQNATVSTTKSVVEYVQSQVIGNQDALNLAHNHLLPLAQKFTTVGDLLALGAALFAVAATIWHITRSDKQAERAEPAEQEYPC